MNKQRMRKKLSYLDLSQQNLFIVSWKTWFVTTFLKIFLISYSKIVLEQNIIYYIHYSELSKQSKPIWHVFNRVLELGINALIDTSLSTFMWFVRTMAQKKEKIVLYTDSSTNDHICLFEFVDNFFPWEKLHRRLKKFTI